MQKDVIYTHGEIITMDPGYGRIAAVGARQGTIVAAGSLDAVRVAMGKGFVLADLQGRTMLPGFIDEHSHFPSGGMNKLFAAETHAACMAVIHHAKK